jgi:hypothetical protein
MSERSKRIVRHSAWSLVAAGSAARTAMSVTYSHMCGAMA